MNTDTGEVVDNEVLKKFIEGLVEVEPVQKRFAPVVRDLTAQEKFNKQISLYAPCGCGSGKKFKFCCHTAQQPTP